MRMMKLNLFSAVLAILLGLSVQNYALVRPHEEGVNTNISHRLDVTSRILEANKGINHALVEGDVALSKNRNAMKCWRDYCKWKKSYNGLVEVPYTISDYFYDSERASIEKAMEAFHQKTCIRFVPYHGQSDYLSIESELGCWSNIGRDGGQQVVSLSVYGCLDYGVIQHELLHALGFHHEHTRSDRDQYVRINWENIPTENAYNFHKTDTNNLNTPYDYSSVMHYGRTAFTSTYGADTITPIPDSSVPIGQRDSMSDIDILRINRLYECNI
ncbi:high choriolytic enzyme 1-like isoform X2 [Toxotes jaculatrix]|uniref:high choriolytic enzyme 1-like isoform X2 n=1 Tax=Toxotes jaculatrix TaxID=941984 RepID=UPI001B3A7D1E|nr:high choriolytic enzyme 1-like isoform X2 [Toxotes jaculatrix]